MTMHCLPAFACKLDIILVYDMQTIHELKIEPLQSVLCAYTYTCIVPYIQGCQQGGATGAIFPGPQVPRLHYPHITVVIGSHIIDLPWAPQIFLNSLGGPAYMYILLQILQHNKYL